MTSHDAAATALASRGPVLGFSRPEKARACTIAAGALVMAVSFPGLGEEYVVAPGVRTAQPPDRGARCREP